MGDPGIPPGGPIAITGPAGSAGAQRPGGFAGAVASNRVPTRTGRDASDFSEAHPTIDLNPIQIGARAWFRWKCDRPVVLIPNTSTVVPVLAGQALAGSQQPIYYVPGRQPNTGSPSMAMAQVSKGAGVVYLPHAGWWNLFWDAQNAASKLDLLVIDAGDPAVASRYLFEAGIHGISTNISKTLTVADSLVLSSNRLRKGFWISLESVITNPGRLGFNAPALLNSGLMLGGTGLATTFGMAGENCFQGEIRGIRDTTALLDAVISVVEWF